MKCVDCQREITVVHRDHASQCCECYEQTLGMLHVPDPRDTELVRLRAFWAEQKAMIDTELSQLRALLQRLWPR